MMADLGMRLIDAAIKLPVEEQSGSNSCPDGYVNQFLFVERLTAYLAEVG